MESNRFDALARTLSSSRRTVLGGLLGGSLAVLLGRALPEDAAAHTIRPGAACRRIKSRPRRRACQRRARAHNRSCHPHPVAQTCAPGCGVRTNNCGKAVACPCPSGRTCLGNGSCAQSCSIALNNCPSVCHCNPDIGTVEHCLMNSECPSALPGTCTSSAGCPPGYSCHLTTCGPGGTLEHRCWPLCPS